jgi:hypothetical protein
VKCHCGRPARARGLCQAHYKKAQRNGTNRRSQDSLVPDTTPPVNGTSDQDFVRSFSQSSAQPKVTLNNGVLTRGDEHQLVGVYCSDCHGETIAVVGGFPVRRKPDMAWCASDRHSIFDSTGRLLQVAKSA